MQNTENGVQKEAVELSDFIKETHELLRRNLGTDFFDSWSRHVEDKQLRVKYAESMKKLATEFWSAQEEECRVSWCYETLKSYFASLLRGCIEKDMRISCCEIDSQNAKQVSQITSTESEKLDIVSSDSFPQRAAANEILKVCRNYKSSEESAVAKIELRKFCILVYGEDCVELDSDEKKSKRYLLDVGSCYNPFKNYNDEQLEVFAIDLTPASEDVVEVDFTQVGVSSNRQCLEERTDSTRLECLPETSYDVITFCLVLSYIPCPFQRLSFCAKARKLLKYNGLLLITETQSITPNNNSMLMKQWKLEIEKLGFRRIVYENRTHIHAMAFRKVPAWLRRNPSYEHSVKLTTRSKKGLYALRGTLVINQDKLKKCDAVESFLIPEPAYKKAKTE